MRLLCFIAGSLMTLAFAPTHFSFLALLLPMVLCFSYLHQSPWQACLRGWLFGLGWALTGGSWIYVSIHRYGGLPVLPTVLIVLAAAALIALYPALQGYCFARGFKRKTPIAILLGFPSLWVLSELARGTLLTGIPWLLIGSSQSNTPLSSYATLGSVYGVSTVTTLISCALLLSVSSRLSTNKRYLCLFLVLALVSGGLLLSAVSFTHPIGKPLKVLLVQANEAPELKWNPTSQQQHLDTYLSLTADHFSAPVVVWSETAIPFLPTQAGDFLSGLQQSFKARHASLITGIPLSDPSAEHFYNGAIVLGEGSGSYLKYHLVPFGEYVPMEHWIGRWLDILHLPMSHFSQGPAVQPLLQVQNLPVAVFICYESIFPAQVRAQLQDASWVISMSDDGWFGDSLGPLQHEQMDQMRAIETGRYWLHESTNGMTSILSPNGQIIAKAPRDQATVLEGVIVPMGGKTPWLVFGQTPLIILLLLMWVIAKWSSR